MKIEADWVQRAETQSVFTALTGAGHVACFVGGCVRNALLGAPVGDIDIATSATPDQVMALTEAAGLKPVPTGVEHGTVTVVAGGVPHEVTTFRRDIETDGRRATIAYATDIHEDASRRDFTMNALYATPKGEVVDPLGGLPDLQARRVRFINDAHQRIREDYLRILRFFRFHAWYGLNDLDPAGLAACAELAEGVEGLSKERIGAETLKLLAAPDPAPSVAAMRSSGVLLRVLPGANDQFLAPLIHVELMCDAQPDPLRRLAILGGEDLEKRLRLSRAHAKSLASLKASLANIEPVIELGYHHGPELAQSMLLMRAAVQNRLPTDEEQAQLAAGAAATFPVVAADLMPAYQGPALGEKLKALEAEWLASGCTLTRDALLS
jgi:poly(A) polymerase